MARYADATCSQCYQVYPGNMMRRVTDRIKTGETKRPGSRSSAYSSRIEQFENRESVLCPACFKSRRRSGCAMLLLVLGLPAAFFLLPSVPDLVKSGALPKNDLTVGLATAGKQASKLQSKMFKSDEQRRSDRLAASNEREPATQSEPQGELVTTEPSASDDLEGAAAAPSVTDQTSSPEAQEALSVAGSTGKRTRWRNEESKGYAVPSSANEAGCRNVYLTDKKMGKDWQSSVETVCP